MKKTILIITMSLMFLPACLAQKQQVEAHIKTKCMPVLIDDRCRSHRAFSETDQLPDLIIVGSSTLKQDLQQRKKAKIKVDDIIYGWTDKKELDGAFWWKSKDEQYILALIRAKYPKVSKANWLVRYSLPATPENIAGAKALGKARLAFYTLSSEYIFLGRELSFAKDERDVDHRLNKYLRNVKVQDVLYGSRELKGETILAQISGFMRRSGETPRLLDKEMIYFIGKTAKHGRLKLPSFFVVASVPGAVEYQVKQILQDRHKFPVKDCVRQIIFQGSTQEAIFIMGSESKGAVQLMWQTLTYRGDEALNMVVDEIKKEMLSFKQKPESNYIRLHNLIAFLGSTKEGKEELARLLNQMLQHITSADIVPMSTMPQRKYQEPEVKRIDTNHCLLWILQNMDREVLVTDFAQKLFQLAQITKARWQSEIQLAINSIALQDIIDLTKNLKKSSKIVPLCSAVDFDVQGKKIVFIPGNTKLMVDGRIYRIKDWQQIGQIKEAEHYQSLISPNGKILYVLGCKNGNILAVDFPSGKVLCKFEKTEGSSYDQGVLTSDGKFLMAVNNSDKLIQLWNTKTGKITKSFPLVDDRYTATLSPNGKLLAYHSTEKKYEVLVHRLLSGKKDLFKIRVDDLHKVLFTPDSRYLLVLTYGSISLASGLMPKLAIYDVREGVHKIAQVHIKEVYLDTCNAMTVSPDAKYVAVASEHGKVWVYDLPNLTNRKIIINDKSSGFFGKGQLVFSPDSKILAVGSKDTNLRLFKTGPLFEQILIGNGQPGKITNAYFSSDGKTVYTYGNQGYVCTWDLKTMKVVKRIRMPLGYKIMGTRGPNGRYSVCYNTNKEEKSIQKSNQTSPARVVDVVTGEIVSQPVLPLGRFRTKIHWINNHEALVATWNYLCRFDYLTGKIIKKLKIDSTELGNGMGDITEDGKKLFLSDRSGGKFTTRDISVWYIDPDSGKESTKIEAKQEIRGGYNAKGLVPGGKYFYYADPDMYILSRKTGKLVAYKDFVDSDLLKVSFSSDGSKYSVVTGARKFVDDVGIWDSKAKSLIRVHDTLSGKMLFACRSPVRFPKALKFSPDGKRLLIAGEDFFEIWPITERQ